MTNSILTSINKKNNLYKCYIRNPNDRNKSKFTKYKNILTTVIRTAKKFYYQNIFDDNKRNLHKTWQTINEIIGKQKKKNDITKIAHNNDILTDSSRIANAFNEYFTNIGPNLASKIPACPYSFNDFTTHISNDASLFLFPTNNSEVLSIISKLPSRAASGVDDIPICILKRNSEIISSPLTYIINLSLSNGVFPDHLKFARVTPIYKSDDPLSIANYRPISVLPAFSKIFERIMYNRLFNFLNKHNLLSENQYGFRKGLSTYMAALELVNFVSDGFDCKETTLGCFIDLSKAFDTVNHDILLQKLYYYGVRGTAHNWFKSYLSNRKQLVRINNHSSSFNNIICGVPQGSILGPLLFLVYINDLPLISSHCKIKFILFADDTSILFKTKNPNYDISIFNNELSLVSNWFKANKLSLNVKKTNFMIFKQSKHNDYANLKLNIDDTSIDQTNNIKFLGLQIDPFLSWRNHTDFLCNKISRIIGILYRVKFYLPSSILLSLYNSLVFSALSYCYIVWGNTFSSYIEKLFIIQKRAVRLITSSSYYSGINDKFNDLRLLTISSIYKHQLGTLMFKVDNNLLPDHFCNFFRRNSSIHNYQTRNSNNFHLHRINTSIAKRSFVFSGINFWNNLSPDIKNSKSIVTFNRKLKNHLLSIQLSP